jgi:hypothetical protein
MDHYSARKSRIFFGHVGKLYWTGVGGRGQAPPQEDILTSLGLPERILAALKTDGKQRPLLALLMDLLNENMQKRMVTAEVQTEDMSSIVGDVESRLRSVEDDFSRQSEAELATPHRNVQQRMLQYQRECDSRARDEVDTELARLRESELSRVRTEERTSYAKQVRRNAPTKMAIGTLWCHFGVALANG